MCSGLHQGVLICCESGFKRAQVDYFPVFVPNEYLFTEYRKTIPDGDKLERWEVYAHAVRDFLSETGGFGLCEQPLRDIASYRKFMDKVANECTVSMQDPPKKFYYPHDAKKSGDVSYNYPQNYITKETSRLTPYDTVPGNLMSAKIHKRD